MKKMIALGLYLAAFSLVAANPFYFKGDSEKNPLTYKSGEEMVFKISYVKDGKPVDGQKLKWERKGDDGKTESGTAVSQTESPLIIKSSIDKPGFVRIKVDAIDENGQKLKDTDSFDGGAGADIEKLTGSAEPADFDQFWKNQLELLNQSPLKIDIVPAESSDPAYDLWQISISTNAKPAYGWLSIPKNAKEKSLPAKLETIGYGLHALAKPNAGQMAGKILIIAGRHGVPLDQPAEFYEKLKSELGSFCFTNNDKPETSYFRDMILRDYRLLQYIKTRPEWNGKDLGVGGGSMGAFQAVHMAALEPAVTNCSIGIPWCADLSGVNQGRQKGWRPDYTPALEYFDIAHQAKRIKCPTTIYMKLGDYVCPPSGELVMYNNMTCPKTLTVAQNGTHGYEQPGAAKYEISKRPPEKLFDGCTVGFDPKKTKSILLFKEGQEKCNIEGDNADKRDLIDVSVKNGVLTINSEKFFNEGGRKIVIYMNGKLEPSKLVRDNMKSRLSFTFKAPAASRIATGFIALKKENDKNFPFADIQTVNGTGSEQTIEMAYVFPQGFFYGSPKIEILQGGIYEISGFKAELVP